MEHRVDRLEEIVDDIKRSMLEISSSLKKMLDIQTNQKVMEERQNALSARVDQHKAETDRILDRVTDILSSLQRDSHSPEIDKDKFDNEIKALYKHIDEVLDKRDKKIDRLQIGFYVAVGGLAVIQFLLK